MGQEKIAMEGISKSFFGVRVLHNVALHIQKGSVHALIGENGAGKSTLMNILAGVYTRDAGSLKIDGVEVEAMTISKAKDFGIAFVHQEINLFNDLKAYENIFLGQELTRGLFLRKQAMVQKADELFSSLGVDIHAEDVVGSLSTAQKQLLEICRSLFTNADVFILDEPTTALSNEEIDHFFHIIQMLKEQGKTFIFISHKMPEIFRICDSYTVLRNGHFISSGSIAMATPEELAREIVGPTFSQESFYEPRKTERPVLNLLSFSGKDFRNIDLCAKQGEIIGLTGLQGSGASELLQTLFGLLPSDSGEALVEGINIANRTTKDIMRHHVGMVPSNRKENSVFEALNILDNFALADFCVSQDPLFHRKADIESYLSYKKELNLKAPSYLSPILSLSGGNQQKVIIARWLKTACRLLLLDNPTQGIDVGAKDEIYRLLLKLASQGKTILFHTLEMNEIRKCADRCLVFYHGDLVADLARDEMDDETVMLYATGTKASRFTKGEDYDSRHL